MGIKSKLSLEGQVHSQVIANLRLGLKRVAEIRLPFQKGMSVDMFSSDCLPYEASKTYRTIMTEFDHGKAQIMKEAQQASLHCT